jgi:four helix bundle protein
MTTEIKSYRDLKIWQKGIQLVKVVCVLTRKFPKSETFGLASQMQRSAVSIPSNIAEGHARQHTGEYRQFLYVALGSAAELDTQMVIASELGYITKEELSRVEIDIVEIRRMIYALISHLSH